MLKTNSIRRFAASVITADIRSATFQDREHLVVPVIAIVEGVIHAVNADTPELVLASELAIAPQGWNGRPVVGDHPTKGTVRVSANEPEVLEEESFGLIFNTNLEEKKLKMEAWIDPQRAKKVGPEAVKILERARARELIEVSVGVFVSVEEKSGVHNGEPYGAIWHDIMPDHLAMLPEGTEGACNIEMGCGAPRAAEKLEDNMTDEKKPQRSVRERLMSVLGLKFEAAEDVSDSDLRNLLDQALYAAEPGYLGINDVFPDDKLVVYAVAPEDHLMLLRRSYKVSKDGTTIKLGEENEEVKAVTRYEALAAGGSCQTCGIKTPQSQEDKKMVDKKEKIDEKKAERIKALIECKNTPWIEDDQAYLETLSDKRLEDLEYKEPEPNKKVDPEADDKQKLDAKAEDDKKAEVKEDVKEMTVEQWMAQAPEEIREVVNTARAAEAKKKTDLITALREATKDVYTDKELDEMSTDELGKLIRLAKIPENTVDYSGKGVGRTEEKVPDPPKLADKFKAAAAKE